MWPRLIWAIARFGLGAGYVGRRRVEIGFGVLDMGLRGEIRLAERRLPRVLRLGVEDLGLRRGKRRLGLFQLRLVDVALDDEEQRALLDQGSVLALISSSDLDARLEIDVVIELVLPVNSR